VYSSIKYLKTVRAVHSFGGPLLTLEVIDLDCRRLDVHSGCADPQHDFVRRLPPRVLLGWQLDHVWFSLWCCAFSTDNWIRGGRMLNDNTIVNYGLALTDSCWNTYASTATGIGPEVSLIPSAFASKPFISRRSSPSSPPKATRAATRTRT
jgi:hypothetical protein